MTKYLIFSTLVFGTVFTFAFVINKSSSTIPDHWTKEMVLNYTNSYGISGEFSSYKFYNDSLHVHKRWRGKNGQDELNYSKPMSAEQFDELLKVLKVNEVDKMKMRKTGTIIYDGAAYSLQLSVSNNFLINLSNSAYEEMDKKYEARFWRVIEYIQRLATTSDNK